jgi:hypothetical protein
MCGLTCGCDLNGSHCFRQIARSCAPECAPAQRRGELVTPRGLEFVADGSQGDPLDANESHEGRWGPLVQARGLTWSYEVDAGRPGCLLVGRMQRCLRNGVKLDTPREVLVQFYIEVLIVRPHPGVES